MRKLYPLLLLALSACTGSQEPPLPALVAAGGEGEVRFYRARDLQGDPALLRRGPRGEDRGHKRRGGAPLLGGGGPL